MKVVLLEDVKGLGNKGDVVEVKDGYGVNYIVPKGLGKLADQGAVVKANVEKKERKEKDVEQSVFVEKLAAKVHKKNVQVMVKASKGGKLYEGLEVEGLADLLKKKWKTGEDVKVEPELAQPLKDIGRHPVEVTLKSPEGDRMVEIILELVEEEE